MNRYETNFTNIQKRIEVVKKSSDFKEDIKVIAVSKNVTSNEILKLHNAGCNFFGENRVQVLKEKYSRLQGEKIEWHFIGRIQTNKINQLIDLNPTLIHSCDSFELAVEIDKRTEIKGKKLDVLLQVNSAKEASKAGVEPEQTIKIYEKILKTCPSLNLIGLMSIGAHTDDTNAIQKSFEITRELYEDLIPIGAKYCSMGMSADFELAVKCGSNMLRIGTALFN